MKKLTIFLAAIVLLTATTIAFSIKFKNETTQINNAVKSTKTVSDQQDNHVFKSPSIINIGDYVLMGKYYDDPILWRCVDVDENGSLMLSDKILTVKPFDAAGEQKYTDGTHRPDPGGYSSAYGSCLWETSNIRIWLNSTAVAENIKWPDYSPTKLSDYISNWRKEKGFLAEGNFTETERNNIKSVSQKSILNVVDVYKLSKGGTEVHKYDKSISNVMQNYDTAYFYNVTDKMFFLDVKQINRVYQNSSKLGKDYYIGKPTPKAVANSVYKYSEGNKYSYWTRTPYIEWMYYNHRVRTVSFDGTVNDAVAESTEIGVRPAFYIKISSETFQSGNGTEIKPYITK